jgi:hypothetical protein
MDGTRRTHHRVRREVDEPGVRASVAADVNIVTSSGGAASSRQNAHVRQVRSTGSAPVSEDSEEKETS